MAQLKSIESMNVGETANKTTQEECYSRLQALKTILKNRQKGMQDH